MVGVALWPSARAAPPRLSDERLFEVASTVFVGAVVADHVDERSRASDHLTIFRVLESEKGDAAVGETVTVRWGTRVPLPMEVGYTGPYDPLPSVGAVMRVHLRGGDLVLGNGFIEVAPRFVSRELIEAADVRALLDAAASAQEAMALLEAESGFRAALGLLGESADRAVPDENSELAARTRVGLARALQGLRRSEEASAVVKPLAFLENGSDEHRRLYLSCVWHTGDDEAYVLAVEELAGLDPEHLSQYAEDVASWFDRTHR